MLVVLKLKVEKSWMYCNQKTLLIRVLRYATSSSRDEKTADDQIRLVDVVCNCTSS